MLAKRNDVGMAAPRGEVESVCEKRRAKTIGSPSCLGGTRESAAGFFGLFLNGPGDGLLRMCGLEGRDVMFQADLGKAHTEGFGLLQGLLALPSIVCNPIAGDNRSRAVRAALAVDKDRIFRIQKGECFGDLLVRRSDDSLHGYVDVSQTSGSYGSSFFSCGVLLLAVAAQIDNRFDAHLGQALPGFGRRLAPTVDMVVHLVVVGDGWSSRKRRQCGNRQRQYDCCKGHWFL
jgi:hypothetical protein